jgi:hypothetical protein
MLPPRIPVRIRLFGAFTIVMLAAALVVMPLRDGGGIAAAAPHNDDFNRSTLIDPHLPVTQSTAGATLEAGETAPCAEVGSTVWFYFVPSTGGTFEVDASGSDFATVVTVFTMENFVPSPPGGSLTPVACGATTAESSGVRLAFAAAAGRMYSIQVGGVSGATGNLHLELRCTPVCPPPNDDVQSALTIMGLDFRHEISTGGATLEPDEPRPCGDIGATVWYRMRSAATSDAFGVTVDATGSGFPVVVALYSPGSPSPPGGMVPLQCSDTGLLSFTLQPHTSVLMQVGGVGGAVGALDLLVTCQGSSCALVAEPVPIDTGGIPAPGGGPVLPPVTGTGGYLPSRGR